MSYGNKPYKDGSIDAYFEFWTKTKVNPATNATFHELHGACTIDNVDLSTLADGTVFECEAGMHYERDTMDISTVKIVYNQNDPNDITAWSCVDGNR